MNSDSATARGTETLSRKTFLVWALVFGLAVFALAVGGYDLIHKINHRSNVRNDQNAVTASEQASTRLLVCTGLEALPQSPGVKALESISYPVYGQPTRPYCPAPTPKDMP